MSYNLLEWLIIGFLIITALLVAAVLVRELIRAYLRLRLFRRSRACRQLISSYQKKQFQDINKLLFFLKDSYDTQIIEHVLREFVTQEDPKTQKQLREIYNFFQFTQQYIQDLESTKWRDRAEAAFMLGQIGDPIAVPYLIKRMKDDNEDEQNVKMACAQALGMIRNTDAIPHLIDALEDVNQWSSVKVAEVLVHFGKKAIPKLQEALQGDRNVNQRMWAAQILGATGDLSAVPPLIQRLRDRDSNVRIATVESLGRLKSPLAVHAVIDLLLRDPVSEVRGQAAITLGQIADERALKPLLNALNDPEYWTRVRAVEALEVIGGAHTEHLSRLVFFDPREEVRRRAAQALERLGVVEKQIPLLLQENQPEGKEAKRLLTAMARLGSAQQIQGYLHDRNLKIRYRVCAIIGEANHPSLEGALLEAAKDEEWVIQIKALGYLAKNQSEEALGALKEALETADTLQRPWVVESLKLLGYHQLEQLYENLLKLVNDENIDIRRTGIELLAQFPSIETYTALTPCLHDPVVEIRLATIESLGGMKDKELTPYFTPMVDDPDPIVRMRACYYMGEMGDERAIESILRALNGADDQSRRVIADALSRFGLDTFYEQIDELMGMESVNVKVGICWVLGHTEDERAIRLLKFFLRDVTPSVRAASIGSLGRIQSQKAAEVIVPALDDVNKRVRASAVNALIRIGLPQGIDSLIRHLSDPDLFVRRRASLAIGWLATAPNVESHLHKRLQEETDERCREYLLLGIGLFSSDKAFQTVLPHFHHSPTRKKLLAYLDREEQPLKQQFLANLRLEHLEESADAQVIIQRYMDDIQQSQDPKQREKAINALGILAEEQALSYLLEALRSDPEESIRQKATTALSNLALQSEELQPQVEKALLEATRDPVPAVCEAALLGLVGHASKKVSPRAFALLTSNSSGILKAAGKLLLDLFREKPAPLLEMITESSDTKLMAAGLLLLEYVPHPLIVRFLKGMLKAPEKTLRINAVRALRGHLEQTETESILIQALDDPSTDVRTWTVRILGRINKKELLPVLFNHSSDPGMNVRVALLSALEKKPPEQVLPTIHNMVSDPAEEVRIRALLSLIQLGSSQSIQIFLTHFKGMPPKRQEEFREFLGQNDRQSLLSQRIQTDLDPQRRRGALAILRTLQLKSATPLFLEALKDPSGLVRKEAARALLELPEPTPEILKTLNHLKNDPDEEIQKLLHQYKFMFSDL